MGDLGHEYGGFQIQAPPHPTPSSPLPELLEKNAVREALTTDTDALQDAVTAQLVQHQPGLQLPGLQREGRTGGVSGGHWGRGRHSLDGAVPLIGGQQPRETRGNGHFGLLKNGWQFHTVQPNLLSTYYVSGRNPCPEGAHSPLGKIDNKCGQEIINKQKKQITIDAKEDRREEG